MRDNWRQTLWRFQSGWALESELTQQMQRAINDLEHRFFTQRQRVGTGLTTAENLLLARYTSGRRRGLVFGLKFILAFGIAPLAVELVAFSYGLGGGFGPLAWILGGFALAAVLAALTLPRQEAAPVPAVAAAE